MLPSYTRGVAVGGPAWGRLQATPSFDLAPSFKVMSPEAPALTAIKGRPLLKPKPPSPPPSPPRPPRPPPMPPNPPPLPTGETMGRVALGIAPQGSHRIR